jgi:hypothetical protein
MKPILSIWFKPKETFDLLLENTNNDKNYLLIFYGIAFTFSIPAVLVEKSLFELGIIYLMLVILLGSFLGGLMLQYIWVYIFWIFGKILQGKADQKQIRVVLAYSILPFIFKSFFMLLRVIIKFGTGFSFEDIVLFDNLTNLILGVLCLRFFVIGLSKAQKFSYGYALINILLPIILLRALIYIII